MKKQICSICHEISMTMKVLCLNGVAFCRVCFDEEVVICKHFEKQICRNDAEYQDYEYLCS